MIKINVIGDSHTCSYLGQNRLAIVNNWENFDCFKIMHLGPLTAYNISEKTSITNVLEEIPENEYIIYSFGEIDCRCRVGRVESKDENIDEITKRYFSFIEAQKNKNIILTNLTPCLFEDPMKEYFEEDSTRREIWHATRGTLFERNKYKQIFNIKLESFCKKNNFIYINFWDIVFNKKEFYIDDVHLNGEKITPIIKELILKSIL